MEEQPDYQGPGEWHTQAEEARRLLADLTDEEVEVATAMVKSIIAEADQPGLALQPAIWSGERAMVVGLYREEDGKPYVLPLAVLLTENVMQHLSIQGAEEEANEG